MKKFLLVIDAQEGFLSDPVTDCPRFRIRDLLERKYFDCVISSVYQNRENSNISRLMGWNKLLTQQEQKVDDIVAKYTNHFLYKNTYSAYSEDLVALLRQENNGQLPESVFIVGFDTDCCVLMTAVDLFESGIRPIVLTQYCGVSGGQKAQFAGIRVLKSLIGSNNIYADMIQSAADIEEITANAKNTNYVSPSCSEKRAERVIELLQKRNWTISFAESCTGGKAAAGIVDIPSASAVINQSFVTYSNESKVKLLGVSEEVIQDFGVVSEQVASQMAEGVAKAASAQVGVGISGIAGPGGATKNKPIGMVCFGFYINGKSCAKTVQFGDLGRNVVREASVTFVYDTLIDLLSE